MLSMSPAPSVQTRRKSLARSAQQQLKRREVSLEQALNILVNPDRGVNLEAIDATFCADFFRLPLPSSLPPLLPLVLWGNCYYLGCPIAVSAVVVEDLQRRLEATVRIVPIDELSYRKWYRDSSIDFRPPSQAAFVSLVAGASDPEDPEDMTKRTERSLAQTENQMERVKAIIASAVRYRASDIHLEPTIAGLRVRYRIDGILRHVTTLPVAVSRKLVMAIKVMCEMDIADSRRPQDGRMAE
jgi:type II secretory ATPase GspE/PulE/Tfp pilus assembly ATPase PilB-like protein